MTVSRVSLYTERYEWRLFQKRVMRNKLDINKCKRYQEWTTQRLQTSLRTRHRRQLNKTHNTVNFIDEQQGPYQFNVLLHKDKTRHIR